MRKLVTVGGGTGSFVLLSGLKRYNYQLTAVVTMADDGGSTGVLRDELGVLPPGDVRQCLTALSDSSQLLRQLMMYRFENGGLQGHSFGNLLLSALEKVCGSFPQAVEEASRLLNVKGRVMPVSEQPMQLEIVLQDGTSLSGEKQLDDSQLIRQVGIKQVKLKSQVPAYPPAVEQVRQADYIIIGPGDHWGSVMPNLLVEEFALAINQSGAEVIYVAPLTNKQGQTSGYTVADYVADVEEKIGQGRVNFVIYNTQQPDQRLLQRYQEQEGQDSWVACDWQKQRSYQIVTGNLLAGQSAAQVKGDKLGSKRSFIRHDSDKLAEAVDFVINLRRHQGLAVK